MRHCYAAQFVLLWKNLLHRPGIEPGSKEWESSMIPLHQRCYMQLGGEQNRLVWTAQCLHCYCEFNVYIAICCTR